MDIAGLSMNLAMIDTNSKIGTAVLGKALEQNEIQGDMVVQMIDSAAMERSVNPHIGSNFDMTV